VIAEYKRTAEKNAARVPLSAIVDRYVQTLSVLGINIAALGRWVATMDNGLLGVGIILTLIFNEYRVVYGLLTLMGFLFSKFGSAFFNLESSRQYLTHGLTLYVEREVGPFFAGHTSAALMKLKDSTSEALDRQSLLLHNAIDKFATESAAALTPLSALVALPAAVETVTHSNDRYATHHEAFLAQSKIIEQVQSGLSVALSAYETSLQTLVQSMGESLGAFIQLHSQNASHALNESLQTQMTRVLHSNQETVDAIRTLLQEQTHQGQEITNQLRLLHERMHENL
jgi:hypothetical protein